jgi:hypothetical protein
MDDLYMRRSVAIEQSISTASRMLKIRQMRMLRHLTKLFSAIIIGLLSSYLVHRTLVPLNSFLASILFLGFMTTTPFTLILVFYNRLRWGMFFFVAVWLFYASAVWLYMLASFFHDSLPRASLDTCFPY